MQTSLQSCRPKTYPIHSIEAVQLGNYLLVQNYNKNSLLGDDQLITSIWNKNQTETFLQQIHVYRSLYI